MFIRRLMLCAPFWFLDFHRLCRNTYMPISLFLCVHTCPFDVLYFSMLSTQDSAPGVRRSYSFHPPWWTTPSRFLIDPLGHQGYLHMWADNWILFIFLWDLCFLSKDQGESVMVLSSSSGWSWANHGRRTMLSQAWGQPSEGAGCASTVGFQAEITAFDDGIEQGERDI